MTTAAVPSMTPQGVEHQILIPVCPGDLVEAKTQRPCFLMLQKILIPVSPGELIDRLTILEVKIAKLQAPDKCRLATIEFTKLHNVCADTLPRSHELELLRAQLHNVNLVIWDTLERVRAFPQVPASDAKAVMDLNDRRAALKRDIDKLFGTVGEQKSFL
jgi:hypothetical protein